MTTTLKGMGASKGIVTGTAKVLFSADEIHRLEPGDILVTRMTTPDFVAGFNILGGIVTDQGGITCHAAIVSREYKLPCVVGTQNATTQIKDGDQVTITVETVKGVVTIN